MKSHPEIRISPISGSWYPSDAGSLRASVSKFIDSAPPYDMTAREVVGVIVPHAGHRYSGAVAGHAYSIVKQISPETVAILSPYHQYSPLSILVPKHSAYQTPLGEIQIAHDLVREISSILERDYHRQVSYIQNDPEHSIEIQIPFLQVALNSRFRIIPIMMRDQSFKTVLALGNSIYDALGDKSILFIASTDLSHFYAEEAANRLDHEILSRVRKLSPEEIFSAEEEGVGFACGKGALATVIRITVKMGADEAQVLNYSTSASVTQDYSSVVGYASAVITREKQL